VVADNSGSAPQRVRGLRIAGAIRNTLCRRPVEPHVRTKRVPENSFLLGVPGPEVKHLTRLIKITGVPGIGKVEQECFNVDLGWRKQVSQVFADEEFIGGLSEIPCR
jgi:hypothetical protein